MRVVVVGASGNVGTALLRRFSDDASVTSVVGVARRVPRGTPPAPYGVATWVECDVASPTAVDVLVPAFAGADAVVHLAWAIQPSHDRRRLHDVNVSGTRHVLDAARRAGVPHVVAASSVGAYSPAPDDVPRGEGWATGGVRSSSYSVDKAAVERTARRVRGGARGPRDRPGAAGARVPAGGRARDLAVLPRPVGAPARDRWTPAGTALARGPAAPGGARRRRRVRVPGGRRPPRARAVQRRRARTCCAARTSPTSSRAGGCARSTVAGTRRLLAAAWHARAVPVGPGWLDMALAAPLLDTSRAERELGWRPAWSAADALRDMVSGIATGAGTASPPLRSRRR